MRQREAGRCRSAKGRFSAFREALMIRGSAEPEVWPMAGKQGHPRLRGAQGR